MGKLETLAVNMFMSVKFGFLIKMRSMRIYLFTEPAFSAPEVAAYTVRYMLDCGLLSHYNS